MQVTLNWTAVPGALFYRVYRGTSSGGPYGLIGQSNPASGQAVTNYQDGPGNLLNGIDYYYVVSAVTVDGESSYSVEAIALAPAQPNIPANVTATLS